MKVVRLSAICTVHLSHPGKYSWYSFLSGAELTEEQLCGLLDYVDEKFLMTPSGIEPATNV
jgi:hypothetical protein